MSAPRLATTVELAFALLSWLGGRQARTAMASGMGTDPGEPVGVRFAVTESLVGANIAPHTHLGAGLIVFEATRHTVNARVETDDSEEEFRLEIRKSELWRAVQLEHEIGLGRNVPSANASRESMSHRRKLADLFLTNATLPSEGGTAFVAFKAEDVRKALSSLSPAAASSTTPSSCTPATSESRAVVASEGVESSPSLRLLSKRAGEAATPSEARPSEDEDEGDRFEAPEVPAGALAAPHARVLKEYILTQKAIRDVAELRVKLEEVYKKWHLLAGCMKRAVELSHIRVTTEGTKVRRVEMMTKVAAVPAAVAPKGAVKTLASCMARAVSGRGARGLAAPSARGPPSVVDLDETHDEGDDDAEEDVGADDSDVSVKSEADEDDETAEVLKVMREAAGGYSAPAPRAAAAISDDPDELIKAFVPPLSVKATEAVVRFVIDHMRDTLLSTGSQVAPHVVVGGKAGVLKSIQLVGTMIVRLSGYVCQSPGELVYASVVQAGSPMPCKTTQHGALALKALREIVTEHAASRGAGAVGAGRDDAARAPVGRASSLGSSGSLARKMDVHGFMMDNFPVFHLRGSGGHTEAGGSEQLQQNIFERGLRVICNSDADRAELVQVYSMLETGVATSASDGDDVYASFSDGLHFVRRVAGLVGAAHTGGGAASARGTSSRWADVFLSEQCGKPSSAQRGAMMLDGGYKHLETVWQTVCSVRAGVEQVLQQEWRRLMRRESLDATELANACWYGRWRKFDLKKAITAEQTSGWLGAVKGDAQSLVSVWAIFTSFFTALTYMMTTLTHHWDSSIAFTLQLISSSAVSALEANVPAAEIIELLPSVVFARFDDAHRDFRTLGRALPVLAHTWAGFARSDAHQRFREVVMSRTRQKAEAGSSSELQKKIKELELKFEQKFKDGQGGGGKASGTFVDKAIVDRFIKEHPGMCWVYHLKGSCTKKDCPHTHGERIAFA